MENIILIQYLLNKMEHLVSQISLHSNLALRSDLKGKTLNSTNQTSKGQEYDSTLTIQSQGSLSIHNVDKAKQINKKITLIEQSQMELQAKFQKVIQSLVKEINKKDEANCQLETQISQLRSQLQESKKDLNIIVAYLAKKKAKANQHQSRRLNLNTTKASGNLQKSISGSKATLQFTNNQMKQQKKNRSPRLQLLKKSYKG